MIIVKLSVKLYKIYIIKERYKGMNKTQDYLVKLLDRIPKEGEKPTVETEKVTYKVEKVAGRNIVKVKACKHG